MPRSGYITDFLRLVRAAHGFRRQADRVKKSARAHQIGRIWMRPPDGASNRYEVGPRTTTLTETNCTSRETALRGRWNTRLRRQVSTMGARAAEHPSRSRTQAALRRTHGMGRHQTPNGNAHIASPTPSTRPRRRGSTAPSMPSVLACLRTTLMLLADDGAHQPVTGGAQSPA